MSVWIFDTPAAGQPGVGPGVPVEGSGTYNASAGDFVMARTGAGPVTVVMPADPLNGHTIGVKDADLNATTNAITVNGNGKTFEGGAGTDVLNAQDGIMRQYTWSTVTNQWMIS